MGSGASKNNFKRSKSLLQTSKNPLLKSSTLRMKDKNTPGSFLMLGLSSAGKTSMIHILQRFDDNMDFQDCVPQPAPTAKRLSYMCKSGQSVFEVVDNPGKQRQRIFWLHDIKDVRGVIFVLDAADKMHLPLAFNEISRIIRAQEIETAPILVALTKLDLAGDNDVKYIEQQVHALFAQESKRSSKPTREYLIQGCSAAQPESIHQAMNWILTRSG